MTHHLWQQPLGQAGSRSLPSSPLCIKEAPQSARIPLQCASFCTSACWASHVVGYWHSPVLHVLHVFGSLQKLWHNPLSSPWPWHRCADLCTFPAALCSHSLAVSSRFGMLEWCTCCVYFIEELPKFVIMQCCSNWTAHVSAPGERAATTRRPPSASSQVMSTHTHTHTHCDRRTETEKNPSVPPFFCTVGPLWFVI